MILKINLCNILLIWWGGVIFIRTVAKLFPVESLFLLVENNQGLHTRRFSAETSVPLCSNVFVNKLSNVFKIVMNSPQQFQHPLLYLQKD